MASPPTYPGLQLAVQFPSGAYTAEQELASKPSLSPSPAHVPASGVVVDVVVETVEVVRVDDVVELEVLVVSVNVLVLVPVEVITDALVDVLLLLVEVTLEVVLPVLLTVEDVDVVSVTLLLVEVLLDVVLVVAVHVGAVPANTSPAT
mmetsp:Transcript_116960/g.325217  ORF Transcript_116960/g.325217 Transcript_116960/m.325217 type:complete len:148 (+) Transcript_116960:130-573(+)